jgi:hypothetical protein
MVFIYLQDYSIKWAGKADCNKQQKIINKRQVFRRKFKLKDRKLRLITGHHHSNA